MSFQKQTKLNFRGKRKRSDSCKSSSLENCHVNKMMKTSYKSTQKYKKYVGNHSKGHPNGFSCNNNNRAGRSVQNNNNHKIIVPNYFGGNARDPLNLNGLIACGGLSHSVTPMSSPMPLLTPHRQDVLVPVFRAANIYDPLNLLGEDTDDVTDQKARLHQRARKKRYLLKIKHKKQNKAVNVNSNNLSGMSYKNINDNMQCRDVTVCNIKETCTNEMNNSDTNATLGSTNETAANNSDITIKRDSSRETSDSQNFKKPVTNSIETSTSALASKNKSSNKKPEDIPTRASKPKRRKSINLSTSKNVIKYNAKSERYCHGNFNSFSSYKNSHYHDKRLDSLPRDKFFDKEVLEIGCNSGFVSIKLSKDFMAKKVLGVDINEKLVNASRSNLNYFSNLSSRKSTSSQPSLYPEHFSKSFGSMCHPLLNLDLTCHEWTNHVKDEVDDDCLKFPHNIHFKCADYVPTSQLEIKNETPQYDVIVALGVTKYIHLNYGDEGLKRTFQKIYRQLRPGGRFIMQAQRWSTYKKKKRINEETLARYKGIKLLPNTFKQYLISPEVGFSQYINWPVHAASTSHHVNKLQKGFRQPLVEFIKPLHETVHRPATNINETNDNDGPGDMLVDNAGNYLTGLPSFCDDNLSQNAAMTTTLAGNLSTDLLSTCCCCSSSRASATYCSTCQNTPSHQPAYSSHPSTPRMDGCDGYDDPRADHEDATNSHTTTPTSDANTAAPCFSMRIYCTGAFPANTSTTIHISTSAGESSTLRTKNNDDSGDNLTAKKERDDGDGDVDDSIFTRHYVHNSCDDKETDKVDDDDDDKGIVFTVKNSIVMNDDDDDNDG